MMMPGHAMDEQEQYLFYTSCLAAARGRTVTVRTFDFGADRTMADAYQGVQSSKPVSYTHLKDRRPRPPHPPLRDRPPGGALRRDDPDGEPGVSHRCV